MFCLNFSPGAVTPLRYHWVQHPNQIGNNVVACAKQLSKLSDVTNWTKKKHNNFHFIADTTDDKIDVVHLLNNFARH